MHLDHDPYRITEALLLLVESINEARKLILAVLGHRKTASITTLTVDHLKTPDLLFNQHRHRYQEQETHTCSAVQPYPSS